jgi:hypothetical protein
MTPTCTERTADRCIGPHRAAPTASLAGKASLCVASGIACPRQHLPSLHPTCWPESAPEVVSPTTPSEDGDMSAQRGSGHPTGPIELHRSEPVRLMLRPGEKADLEVVAEAWGVPVGTAGWAILSEVIAGWRGQYPELGAHGVAIAAASHALRRAGWPPVDGASAGVRLGTLLRVAAALGAAPAELLPALAVRPRAGLLWERGVFSAKRPRA